MCWEDALGCPVGNVGGFWQGLELRETRGHFLLHKVPRKPKLSLTFNEAFSKVSILLRFSLTETYTLNPEPYMCSLPLCAGAWRQAGTVGAFAGRRYGRWAGREGGGAGLSRV